MGPGTGFTATQKRTHITEQGCIIHVVQYDEQFQVFSGCWEVRPQAPRIPPPWQQNGRNLQVHSCACDKRAQVLWGAFCTFRDEFRSNVSRAQIRFPGPPPRDAGTPTDLAGLPTRSCTAPRTDPSSLDRCSGSSVHPRPGTWSQGRKWSSFWSSPRGPG